MSKSTARALPYGYPQLERQRIAWQHTAPHVHTALIGHSVEGRALWAFTAGRGRNRVVAVGGVHANEGITTPLLVEAFNRLHTHPCMAHVRLTVIPLLNPDGVQRVHGHSWGHVADDWKANARGVDLNDQFPAYWAHERWRRNVTKPGPRDYGGPYPMSEPESRAVARWLETHACAVLLSFHSQGREIYYHYRGQQAPDAATIAQHMAQRSGYAVVNLQGSDAGLRDWFIHRWQKPAFTIEVGHGVNPLPMAQLPQMVIEGTAMIEVALDYARSSKP